MGNYTVTIIYNNNNKTKENYCRFVIKNPRNALNSDNNSTTKQLFF